MMVCLNQKVIVLTFFLIKNFFLDYLVCIHTHTYIYKCVFVSMYFSMITVFKGCICNA